jgi:hypothetical protein
MQNVSTRVLLVLAIVLGIIALALWTISEHNRVALINSYEACASAGYPILESYPSQCKTPNGRTFVNPNEKAEPYVAPTSTAASTGCVVGGCSGEVCSDASQGPLVSNCIYKPEFACYKSARCERQADGACGWSQTYDLVECLRASAATNTEVIPQ